MTALVTTAPRSMQLQQRPETETEPGPGQLRIRPRFAGICGTDLHIFQGHHPNAKMPLVQGHEFIAVVEAVGPQVEGGFKPGDRIVVEPLVSCLRCEACRRGFAHVCRRLQVLGVHRDGAFGSAMLVDAAKAIAVPDGLSDRIAALTEPFAVALHDCRRAGLLPAERALVIGGGPIGLAIGIVAAFCGARVRVCEPRPARLALARSLGLEVIDAADDPAAQCDRITGGEGFDVVFEVSGAPGGVELAAKSARARGRVCQVGLFAAPAPTDHNAVVFKELSWIGSRVYSFDDFRDTVDLLERIAADARFDPALLITDTCTLEQVPRAIGRMIDGEVDGKVMVELGAG